MILTGIKRLAAALLVLVLMTGCGATPETAETTLATETVVETTEMLETVETTAETEPTLPPIVYETGEAHGAEAFFYTGTSFPVGLGYPKLSDEQIDTLIAEKDYAKTAATITTLADAVNFYNRLDIEENPDSWCVSYGGLHHWASAWQALDQNKMDIRSIVSLTHYLLEGDYEDVGYIWISNKQNVDATLYIYTDGLYYLVNPREYLEKPRSTGWLSSFSEDLIACSDDFQIIANSMVKNWPSYFEKHNSSVKELYLIRSEGDFVVGSAYPYLAFPAGTEVTEYLGTGFVYLNSILDWQSQTRLSDEPEIYHGTKVFSYAGTSLPVGLGQPKLNDAEIDALIAEENYAKMAETITTMADAANLCYRMKLDFDESRDNNTHGEFHYRNSAWSVLENGIGQCVSMSNLIHYLLRGDYEDVGYVNVRTYGDGHVMNYIRHEGMYYLINSADYTIHYNADHTDSLYKNSWIQDWPSEMICAAEDFQTIADSIKQYMTLGDGGLPQVVHLVQSPGDYVVGGRGQQRLYPEEYAVTEYYGFGFTFAKADALDWQSQTRLDN